MKQHRNLIISIDVEYPDDMDWRDVDDFLIDICDDIGVERSRFGTNGTINVKSSCAYIQD
jgi:hypothetical protein